VVVSQVFCIHTEPNFSLLYLHSALLSNCIECLLLLLPCLCLQVFCIHTEPNFSLPWQRKRQYSSNSSGFMIAGRRILTNAHCVDHHTQVGFVEFVISVPDLVWHCT
jgi:hypothetical protein